MVKIIQKPLWRNLCWIMKIYDPFYFLYYFSEKDQVLFLASIDSNAASTTDFIVCSNNPLIITSIELQIWFSPYSFFSVNY